MERIRWPKRVCARMPAHVQFRIIYSNEKNTLELWIRAIKGELFTAGSPLGH